MDQIITQPDTVFKSMNGFFKIWNVDPVTGKPHLLRSKRNMILNEGADLLAQALAGVKYANISHMYIGYKNTTTFSYPADATTIDKVYSNKFSSYGSGSFTDFGYLKLPLAYSPSFIAQTGYESNVALFTSVIATGVDYEGAEFRDSSYEGNVVSPPSNIFEVALVAALDPANDSQDKVFSRANFEPLLYNPSFNLTTTWGVQFLA